MDISTRTDLVATLCQIHSQGPEARQRLEQLSDQIVADSGGELTASDREGLSRAGLNLDTAAKVARQIRTRDTIAGLVALAYRMPGTVDRVARLSAELSTKTAALSAGGGVSLLSAYGATDAVPTELTAFDKETCKKFGLDEATVLRGAQAQAERRLRQY